MSRDEALTAVLNAARVLRDGCSLAGVHESAPVRPLLAQLYAAVDAVDAVGDAAMLAEDDYVMPAGRRVGRIVGGRYEPVDRPGLCQGDPDCYRVADLPSGTCHHHSPYAQQPHPWERAQLRTGVFAVPEGETDV